MELLVVIAIMTIMAAIGISALGTTSAQKLNSAGNEVADLVNQARQNAISKDKMTALVVVSGTNNTDVDYRVLVIWEYDPANNAWQQASKWITLPEGTTIDPTPDATTAFFGNSPGSSPTPASAALPAMKYLSNDVTPRMYVIFLPGGQIIQQAQLSTPVLRVVGGKWNGDGTVTYIPNQKNADGDPINYYDIYINNYTGMAKIGRP